MIPIPAFLFKFAAGKVLSVFAGPYAVLAKWGVIALMVTAFGAFAWFKGNAHGTQKLIDYQAAQAVEAVRINTARAAVTAKVVTKYVKVAGQTKTVTEIIEKEVVKYVDANPGYCLDAGWRRLHDAGADNAVSDAGPGADAAGGAPGAAEALETVTANYAACHRTADRLDALQSWVKAQEAVK